MIGSAHSVRTSLGSGLGLVALVVSAGACAKEDAPATPRYEQPVAEVAGRILDQSVVEMIAARDGVDDATARERALETLRLAAAYEQARREQSAELELIEPGRAAHLLRSARARLWLAEDFEPRHRPEDIPAELIAANMDKPALFHPEVHAICNAIVVPAEVDAETGRNALPPAPERDPDWWKRAEELMRPVEATLHRYIQDPGREPGCNYFGRVARLAAPKVEGLELRIEQGGFEVCSRERWDPGFVDALCGRETTGWVEPFRTRFGVHVVAILSINAANEPDDEGRRAQLRERMHPSWQKQAFGEYMEQLRAKRTVRLGPGLRAGETASQDASARGEPGGS